MGHRSCCSNILYPTKNIQDMEKQVVVRLLRGYFNCCSNKWKIIYIMKKDTWVIVRLQYFSCCSTIRKYFVKIFTHFESDLKVIVKYLMGHWSCWLFNTFAWKYEKSTICRTFISQTPNSSSSGSRQAREELKKRKIIYIQFPRWWAH